MFGTATPAGNTAICTVGYSGNDLHYRGYDIRDLATHCEYEEVAYLLVHDKLPNTIELTAYKTSLAPLRSLPAAVKQALEEKGVVAQESEITMLPKTSIHVEGKTA